MPAGQADERVHELALFLDWLADAALLGPVGAPAEAVGTAADLPAGLFLASDAKAVGTGPADDLRASLLGEVAAVLEEACDRDRRPDLRSQEARHLARVLRFLVEQGWRPGLAPAWRFAESHKDVRRPGVLLGHPGV
jgi:hypothetical protein